MAFAEEDKFKIIFSLCHTGGIIIDGNTNFNSIIRDRLLIDNEFVEEQALSLVSKIAGLKEALEGGTKKDAVTKIGDIHFDTKVTRSSKTKELQRLLNELSNLLDIPNRCKVGSGGVGCLIL